MGGAHGALPPSITCDVAIIGSGAGAGITAELLTKAGLKVVIIEEGQLKSSSDFTNASPKPMPRCTKRRPDARPATKGTPSCKGAAWVAPPPSTGPASHTTHHPEALARQVWLLTDFTLETLVHPTSSKRKNGSTSPRGKPHPMRTTNCYAAVLPSWASRPKSSRATSRVATTWALVAWVGPTNANSPCW